MILAVQPAGPPSTLEPRMPTPPIRTATPAPIAPEKSPDSAAGVRAPARLLDSAVGIPGTNLRCGLDALIGLVPGVGDMAGAALSGYIVLAAARLGAPKAVLLRMVLNVAIDTGIGSVPLLGDLFDAGWRSNTRNTALLDRHLESPVEAKRASAAVIAGVVGVLALLAIGAVALTVAVLRLVASALG